MGSPYIVTSVSRVNVVRTSRGFSRLSQEMRRITDSEFLGVVESFVAGLLDQKESHEFFETVYGWYQTKGADGLIAYLNTFIPDWNAFCLPYLDFCVRVLDCMFRRARVVVTVTVQFSGPEKDALDRAVVLDFTTK